MNHTCLYSQPQSITALWLVLISHPIEGRRLSWHKWLGEILRWVYPSKTVTHPSTNRARRRVTSLICPTMLLLGHATTCMTKKQKWDTTYHSCTSHSRLHWAAGCMISAARSQWLEGRMMDVHRSCLCERWLRTNTSLVPRCWTQSRHDLPGTQTAHDMPHTNIIILPTFSFFTGMQLMQHVVSTIQCQLECGPMPNMMAALPNIGGALCLTPQSMTDTHY